MRRDIDNERRSQVLRKRRGINNLVRPIRFAGRGKILQSGEETSFIAESRSVVVIRVARLPIGNDDGARTKLADFFGEAKFVLTAGLHVGVGNAENSAITE